MGDSIHLYQGIMDRVETPPLPPLIEGAFCLCKAHTKASFFWGDYRRNFSEFSCARTRNARTRMGRCTRFYIMYMRTRCPRRRTVSGGRTRSSAARIPFYGASSSRHKNVTIVIVTFLLTS